MPLAQGKRPANLNKAIIFKAGRKLWACNLDNVKEIVRTSKISSLPNSLKSVVGVINVRGEVIPVIATWPGLQETFDKNNNKKNNLVVLLKESSSTTIGLLVEEVSAIEKIDAYDFDSNDGGTYFVHLSNSGQLPLIDGKVILDYLKGNLD